MKRKALTITAALLCCTAALAQHTLGTDDISADELVGTWSRPVAVAVYSGASQQAAADADNVTGQIEAAVNDVIERMGVGAVVVEFRADGTVTGSTENNTSEGNYTVSGSTLTVSAGKMSFSVNAKLTGDKLQLLYPLSSFPKQITKYFLGFDPEGLYLGAELERQ
ncbi:MAG: DUF4923 family protein [Prevotellaceae bacterium]|nr:DUF4923 family protein [Prevotellaceae bacterium]